MKIALDSRYVSMLRLHIRKSALTRQHIIVASNEVLFLSKRVIFDLHKEDTQGAQKGLVIVQKKLKSIQSNFRAYPYIHEGAYRAAVEEYAEAALFLAFCTKKNMSKVFGINQPELYLAGLCDVPGEIYRFALSAVARKDAKAVDRAHAAAFAIYTELSLCDFTQYLRTKFDQTRSVMHKLEELRAYMVLRT